MEQDPADEAQDDDALNRMGEEPDEESGAGYGNHAVPDEPGEPGKDA